MIAIKHLGTNGGGWFGANSAHPLENPDYLTNVTEITAQFIIPVAMILAFGFFIEPPKLGDSSLFTVVGVFSAYVGLIFYCVSTWRLRVLDARASNSQEKMPSRPDPPPCAS